MSSANSEYRMLLYESNREILNLKKNNLSLEQALDQLVSELHDVLQDDEKHVLAIEQLKEQLAAGCEQKQSLTFSSRTYGTWIRELYYSLLSLNVPSRKVKPILQNVLACVQPSFYNDGDILLPGKSCAAYMRSHELPSISRFQKANELVQAKEWHLSSDGTTLNQQKKVAFMINGLVFGVHDVSNGSSQCILDALQSELKKLGNTTSIDSPLINVDRIVSCTGDGASTQI